MYHQKGKMVLYRACQLSQDSQALHTCLLSKAVCLLPSPVKHLTAEGSRLYLKDVLGFAGHGDLLQRLSISLLWYESPMDNEEAIEVPVCFIHEQ